MAERVIPCVSPKDGDDAFTATTPVLVTEGKAWRAFEAGDVRRAIGCAGAVHRGRR